MKREYPPLSRLLRSGLLLCAATITFGVAGFIDLPASDHGVTGADAARAASVIVARR